VSKYDGLTGENKLLHRQILPACKSRAVCHITKKEEKKERDSCVKTKQKKPATPK